MMQSMELIKPLLLDNPEVIQAYGYRVIREICVGIQFSAFSNRHPLSFAEQTQLVNEASAQPLLRDAFAHIDISRLPGRSWRIKAELLKHRFGALYVFMKRISG